LKFLENFQKKTPKKYQIS